MKKLAPSLLSADFSRLGEQAELVSRCGADYLHIDVMDGHFVPNISYGASVMKSLDKCNTVPYDVHLMIENADLFVDDFVTDKTEYIIIHQEACTHLHRSIQNIKSKGVKAGVALNPATPICMLENIIEDVDLVLIMSVNPGFGGQKFIDGALSKIMKLSELRSKRNLEFVIEVDGGVSTSNAKLLIDAGADILVAGSAVFGATDIAARMSEFKELMK
ncbi:MAG: ribulose-phosphate 3-epimerase [Eubacterium sp.]|nr:ribulose-phosphate 3-epimerase [Eubacterium sp.]